MKLTNLEKDELTIAINERIKALTASIRGADEGMVVLLVESVKRLEKVKDRL